MECTNFFTGNCKEKMKGEVLRHQSHYVDGFGTVFPQILKDYRMKINPRVFWCQHCRNANSTFSADKAPTTQQLMTMIIKFSALLKEYCSYKPCGKEYRCSLYQVLFSSEDLGWRPEFHQTIN